MHLYLMNMTKDFLSGEIDEIDYSLDYLLKKDMPCRKERPVMVKNSLRSYKKL